MIFLWLACTLPTPPALNVLLVSMDTVRYDHTSLGGTKKTTPNLATLAQMGTTYRNAYAVGNESLYSHAALFTGHYPSEVAVPDYGSFAVPDGIPTLAGVLSAYGYHTAAFTGGGHIIADFGFNKGFELFQSAKGGTRFASFFDAVPPAIAWIKEQGNHPWFAFVHGYDAHSPYLQRGPYLHATHPWATPRVESIVSDPLAVEQIRGRNWFPDRSPSDFVHAAGRHILSTDFYSLPAAPQEGERVESLSDPEIAHIKDHYDSGLMYADLWLGQLLSQIDLSQTLVIVVADHGEDVLDHGYMNHRAGLWDSTLHVPLVVACPCFPQGQVRDAFVDLRSVMPTILEAVGAVFPASLKAPSLQSTQSATTVFAEGVMDMISARSNQGRLTIHNAQLVTQGLDLATLDLQDPRVSFSNMNTDQPGPVGPAQAAQAEVLRQAILAWRKGLVRNTVPGADIPDALRDALRTHGYWTPESQP